LPSVAENEDSEVSSNLEPEINENGTTARGGISTRNKATLSPVNNKKNSQFLGSSPKNKFLKQLTKNKKVSS